LDIGLQPANRSNPGSTLVCVTTNINTACCRAGDNPSNLPNGGAVGKWLYPNGTLVSRPSGNVVDFARLHHTQQVRLARLVSVSTPPLGVYTCEVPTLGDGTFVTATITLLQTRKCIFSEP